MESKRSDARSKPSGSHSFLWTSEAGFVDLSRVELSGRANQFHSSNEMIPRLSAMVTA
jgi:hypothetical protein